ncbi:TRAP transporter substrate-binding protein [Sinobaca sp. H24]|uniref:TRAP transporter substrate-binding protein n=1 Tax=Sinobaca sp. H24 TaxID=2923376 RepID=UPI00207A5CED|nr:TRAP transporter substrate-binding protein [Sinobaca sp. H24]
MKKAGWLSALTALLIFVSGCSQETQGEEVTTWKLNHFSDTSHNWHRTAEFFAERVEENTDGQVVIDIYPSGQLGDETNTINSIQYGAIDLTITGETLQNWTPNAILMATPYAFESQEHMRRIIEGDIGRTIEEDIQKDAGLTPLLYIERSPRNLTSNAPIHSPEDIQGFDMRVPNVPLFVDVWSEAGANPQLISLSEVFTALQQGVIQGQENPNDLIQSNGFYEVQDYINETEHVRSWIYITVGNEQMESLPEDQQQGVLEAAEDAQEFARELYEEDVETVENTLREEGVQFNEDVDQEAFREAMIPAIEENLEPEQQELYRQILEEGEDEN